MIISAENFKNSFIPIRDNYVLEIKTREIYTATYLDDKKEILLLEPKEYEEKLEILSQKVTERFEKILDEIV